MTATAPQLSANERIEELVVTKDHPVHRTDYSRRDSDFEVRTCQKNCGPEPGATGPVVFFADRGATGRVFLFVRTPEGFRLVALFEYVE
jgi:hypothetical protein